MSQPAKLAQGNYEITSLVLPSSQPIGVGSNQPPTQAVQGNSPVWVWFIQPVSTGGYQLSLVNAFPYIGLSSGGVIATTDRSKNHIWYIYEYKGNYTIATQPTSPTPAWTVSSAEAEITISTYQFQPAQNQLFNIKPVSSSK